MGLERQGESFRHMQFCSKALADGQFGFADGRKIEMLETNRDKLERDIGELSRATATLQSRFDESLNEQAS